MFIRDHHKRNRKAQITIEYVVIFAIISAVVIISATTMIRPSVNKLMNDVSKKINKVGTDFLNN